MSLTNRYTVLNADVDSLEDVAEIEVLGFTVLWVQIAVATAALSDFRVDFRIHPDGAYFAIGASGADYTDPDGPILGASGDLTAAGVGTHWIKLDVTGVESVRLRAAGTSSVVTGFANKG